MSTMDDRIARLQKKMVVQPRTKKEIWLAEQVRKLLINQNGKCVCGYRWEGHDKPVVDYVDKKNREIRGLICVPCDMVITNCHNDPDKLDVIAKYIRSGGTQAKIHETFETKQPTNWGELK